LIVKSRSGWTTKLHLIAANDEYAVSFSLSPGNFHDDPEGEKFLNHNHIGNSLGSCSVIMDRAYDGNETRNKEYGPVI
jgi:hypothetical protein